MTADSPLFRRVDHLIIRVSEPNYSKLMAVFSDTFGLYQPWPVSDHPVFRSGGIFAGNVDLELMEVKTGESATARIFGIEYELCHWEQSVQEMKRRGLPHVAVPYIQQEGEQGSIDKWLNVFYKDMIGSTVWMKLYFSLMHLLPEKMLRQLGSGDSTNNAQAVDFVFNRVYRQGAILAVKYNPVWRDIDAEREESQKQHTVRSGGPLGVVGVREVVVGTPELDRTRREWQKLFAPVAGSDDCWQVGTGPAVRLVPSDQNTILYMDWQVRSLEAARDFLRTQGMVGVDEANMVQILPDAVCGLDIRLIEA